MRAFASRGEENPDGWGVAWYPDRAPAAAIVKQPIKWGESKFAKFMEADAAIRSSLFIAHVRHKTTGGAIASYADTHPFSRHLDGREYCFAHNGTLETALWDRPVGRHQPIGETDSERAFCHMLHALESRGGLLNNPDAWQWLHAQLSGLNRLGKLNALLADGDRLFVYHDVNGWKGLTFRKITIDDQHARHIGDDVVNVELTSPATDPGYAIATCPLDESEWQTFHTGELIVFEAGIMKFSSHRTFA